MMYFLGTNSNTGHIIYFLFFTCLFSDSKPFSGTYPTPHEAVV